MKQEMFLICPQWSPDDDGVHNVYCTADPAVVKRNMDSGNRVFKLSGLPEIKEISVNVVTHEMAGAVKE